MVPHANNGEICLICPTCQEDSEMYWASLKIKIAQGWMINVYLCKISDKKHEPKKKKKKQETSYI